MEVSSKAASRDAASISAETEAVKATLAEMVTNQALVDAQIEVIPNETAPTEVTSSDIPPEAHPPEVNLPEVPAEVINENVPSSDVIRKFIFIFL